MADDNVMQLSDLTFDDAVETGVVLVDLWAPWCSPCLIQGPIVEEVARAVDGRARVAKLNVDEGQAIAARLGVQGIPTVILFKDGEEIQRFVGVHRKDILLSAVENALEA